MDVGKYNIECGWFGGIKATMGGLSTVTNGVRTKGVRFAKP